jgi:diguanylate cyclase (GGDEF)-like protein
LPHDYSVPDELPLVAWSSDTSLLFTEINHMRQLNEKLGHAYGDSAIRWLSILLAEESGTTVYRVGGVEFVVLLKSGTFEDHEESLRPILARIAREGEAIGMAVPAVHVALIRYKQDASANPATVLMQMNEAMLAVKKTPQTAHRIFLAKDLKVTALAQKNWVPSNETDISSVMRWISNRNVHQILNMGMMLNRTQQEAYMDAVSGLPNMRAAHLNLERRLQISASENTEFSILLIDGDNIHAYNDVNYAAGDKMIHDMGAVFKNNLRPSDFVARWRSGDEFIAVLPDTTGEGAKVVGERFRLAVKEASHSWRFPTTISIGIAVYPTHGNGIAALVDRAESALQRAKSQGKDQVILTD